MTTEQRYYYATGRRKSAIARVRLYKESGPGIVNGRPMEEFFPWPDWLLDVNSPFQATSTSGQYRVVAKITGGGPVGQAGALRHGIARALQVAEPSLRTALKRAGLLTRDSREKESKKYGLKRARKAQQYTKR